MTEPGERFTFCRLLACRNVGSTTISAFKGVEVTGMDADGTLQVVRARFTNNYTATHSGVLLWNNVAAMAANEYGSCTVDYPAFINAVVSVGNLAFEVP